MVKGWRSVPSLRIVITARRERFDAPVIQVPPLEPDAARRLLVQRGQEAAPSVAVSDAVARSVAELVDGIPLGLELAAARLRILEPDDLVARMTRDVGLLGGGARSLQAVFEGSLDMLTASERQALVAGALFPNGFTLDELLAVAGLSELVLLDAVDGLVRSALVVRRPEGFRQLDVIRAFAAARVGDELVEAWVGRCVEVARELYDSVHDDPRGVAVRLAREAPRLADALERTHDVAQQAQLAVALRTHAVMTGRPRAVHPVLDEVDVRQLPPALAVAVLNARAAADPTLATAAARLEAADLALAYARELDDPHLIAESMMLRLYARRMLEGTTQEVQQEAVALGAFVEGAPLGPTMVGLVRLAQADIALDAHALDDASGLLASAQEHLEKRPKLLDAVVQRRALTYRRLGHPREALALLEPVWGRVVVEANPVGFVHLGLEMASCAAASGDVGRATHILESVGPLAAELGMSVIKVLADLLSADLLESSAAIPALHQIAERAERLGYRRIAVKAHSLVGWHEHTRGDPAGARSAYLRGEAALGRLHEQVPELIVGAALASLHTCSQDLEDWMQRVHELPRVGRIGGMVMIVSSAARRLRLEVADDATRDLQRLAAMARWVPP